MMTMSVQWLCMAPSLNLPVMNVQTVLVSARPSVTSQFALSNMSTHMRKSAAHKLQSLLPVTRPHTTKALREQPAWRCWSALCEWQHSFCAITIVNATLQ